MRISEIKSTPDVTFGRKLSANEMKIYNATVNEGLNVLNKEIGLIIHNSSAPALKGENTGIGSLLSKATESFFAPFLKNHGFKKIQQEPDNTREGCTPSPYSPLTQAKNILMIPIEKLATNEYANILSKETLDKIYASSNNEEFVNFGNVKENYDKALREAYENYKEKLIKPYKLSYAEQDTISALESDIKKFKIKNSEDEEKYAIYEILSKKYGDERWEMWDEVDRNLYNAKTTKDQLRAKKRENEIMMEHRDDVDFHMFKQAIVNKEIAKAKENNKKLGISVIGDSPVAFTKADVWMNQDIFLKDVALGCRPDAFSPNGQRWNFPVLDPDKIFNPDKTLGEGGKVLRNRYEKMFESSNGGVRIDHIIGLIDPFVYSTKENFMTPENSGRLYSSPNHPMFAKYAKCDVKDFAAILEKIVIPAAEKFGLTKNDIICEDLGEVTEPVAKVMDRLKLSGLSVTEFDYRGKESGANKVIMLGSHDNPSFIEFTDGLFNNGDRARFDKKTEYLAQDTIPAGQNFDSYRYEIRTNKKKFMAASFAELFTSPAKRIQFFFTDFFGIGKTYNKPGTTEGCWSLRLSSDFENQYYENLKNETAVNLPETIATAIRHKGKTFVDANKSLLEKLDNFAKILKQD